MIRLMHVLDFDITVANGNLLYIRVDYYVFHRPRNPVFR